MRIRRALVAGASAAWAGLAPVAAQACPVCWIPGGSPEHDAVARGFYWGVLFLMAMPFAVAGTIGGWLWYTYRRRRRPAGEASVRGLAWVEQGGRE